MNEKITFLLYDDYVSKQVEILHSSNRRLTGKIQAMKPVHNVQRLGWLLVLWFVVVGLGLIGGFVEFLHRPPEKLAIIASPTPVPEPALILDPQAERPVYTAKEVWLYERSTNTLLYEDRAQEATSVASLAKLMTALVAYENYDLQAELPIGSAAAVLGNRAKFRPRDRFSVADLLRAMLIFSANDAAQAIANGLGTDDSYFIAKMNDKAKTLGLLQTHFANSFGLDNPEQFSSAADIGQLTNVVLNIPFLEDIVGQEKAELKERGSGRSDTVFTTNSLLRQGPQYRGVKTGTTEQAGESLVVRYVADSVNGSTPLDLILVILGSESRFTEAKELLHWAVETVKPTSRFAAFSAN